MQMTGKASRDHLDFLMKELNAIDDDNMSYVSSSKFTEPIMMAIQARLIHILETLTDDNILQFAHRNTEDLPVFLCPIHPEFPHTLQSMTAIAICFMRLFSAELATCLSLVMRMSWDILDRQHRNMMFFNLGLLTTCLGNNQTRPAVILRSVPSDLSTDEIATQFEEDILSEEFSTMPGMQCTRLVCSRFMCFYSTSSFLRNVCQMLFAPPMEFIDETIEQSFTPSQKIWSQACEQDGFTANVHTITEKTVVLENEDIDSDLEEDDEIMTVAGRKRQLSASQNDVSSSEPKQKRQKKHVSVTSLAAIQSSHATDSDLENLFDDSENSLSVEASPHVPDQSIVHGFGSIKPV